MNSKALLKALQCLETFQESDDALTAKEIAAMTGLSQSSVQRSTYTLEALGYIERNVGLATFSPGRSCMRAGYGYLRSNRFLEAATPYLIDMSERFDMRADLAVPDGTMMVYLARILSRDELMHLAPIGHRMPSVSSSAGRAVLAALPPEQATQIILGNKIRAMTPRTETDPEKILDIVESARQLGYAYQGDELLMGAASVSATVRDKHRNVLGSIVLGGATARFEDPQLRHRAGEVVIRTANAISSYNL